jgi:hypothetical protein
MEEQPDWILRTPAFGSAAARDSLQQRSFGWARLANGLRGPGATEGF